MPAPLVFFAILLTLKLTDVIDWSWWWITLPLWAGLALIAAFWVVGAFALGIAASIEAIANKKK